MISLALDPRKAVMLIPSLEPDDRLPAYVEKLLAQGFERVVIVDDGSAAPYQPIFSRLDAMDGCTVLHHDVNHGKGVALKTGYAWIDANCPEAIGVITADADGQHTVKDCWKLAQALAQGGRALYLGSRDFSLPNVPKRSRRGNRITTFVFWMLYGQWLPDTQTGLRAFPRADLSFMTETAGDRFEYEMNVLIACARQGIPMIPVTIDTVYENENAGTHFHPVRDSIRIYKVILGSFVKFIGTSLLSFLIDQGLAWILADVVLIGLAGIDHVGIIWASGLLARLVSSVCNFLMNRTFVFKLKSGAKQAVWKYAALCVVIICLSNLGVTALSAVGMNDRLAKILCDTALYFLSYRVQNRWVFKEERREADA